MVVAGVFFYILIFHVISINFIFMAILRIIRCITILVTSFSALHHHDMKKVIALSTASQLGFIVLILRMGIIDLAFFHLISHGFFKALLFLCRGVIIHNGKNSQDFRKSSKSTTIFLPILKSIFFFRSLALMGLPFLGAFFSKHKVLQLLFISNFFIPFLMILFLSLSLTVAYSLRLMRNIYSPLNLSQSQEENFSVIEGYLGYSLL